MTFFLLLKDGLKRKLLSNDVKLSGEAAHAGSCESAGGASPRRRR